MKAQIVMWGNRLAIRIPKLVAQQAKLMAGDSLEIEAVADGRVELRRAARIPNLAQLVAQINPENRYEEISSAAEVGWEAVES